jgi:hypothetical protein
MVILVIIGAATVLGVIIAAVIETRRMNRGKASVSPTAEKPAERKKS